MDFFQAQDSARSRTKLLVALFIAAVVAIIVCIYAVVHMVVGPGTGGGINVPLLALVAVATTALVGLGSTVRTLQLRQGGARVAELLGGRRIRSDTTDAAERRLVNIVEEMAIASGTPVPAIFVLDREQGINAFAAGYTLDDAAVAVTRGTLEQLDRDELQGVIAHEFSHILNGDMRLNIRLMGILFGILLLTVSGRVLLRSGFYAGGGRRGGKRNGGGGQIAIIGLALVLIGYIGVFFGRLIQAAVSRQREYLADAAAVQFTRNPEGLAGALARIGAGAGSRIQDAHAQEAGHLFFANGLSRSFTSLLATHPPLEDRIRRIRPAFAAAAPKAAAPRPARGAAGTAPLQAGGAAAATQTARGLAGAELVAAVGAPQQRHVAYASRLLASLPDRVRDAAHDPERAAALLFALLLFDEAESPVVRTRRVTALESRGGATLREEAESLAELVRGLGEHARLPLLDLLLPALRELAPDAQRAVRSTAAALAAADEHTDMFEMAMLHVLNRQLAAGDERPPADVGRGGARSTDTIRDDIAVVLAALARSDTDDEGSARAAFEAGAAELRRHRRGLELVPPARLDDSAIDAALDRIRGAAPAVRRLILEAGTHTVAHDGRIAAHEAEMLRAFAEAIDCPIPPVAV